MDIGNLSTIALNQLTPNTPASDISVALLGKQLDMSQKLGSEMVKAMEQSVNPHLGGNIDVSV